MDKDIIMSGLLVQDGEFSYRMGSVQRLIHANAILHGWWEYDRNFGEMIALMHSELSEALEAWRAGNPKSDHIPEMDHVLEEFADVVIRIMDTCENMGYDLGSAIIEKSKFNVGREYRHGNKAA